MKTYIKHIVLIILIQFTVSCESDLIEEPTSYVAPEQFYNTSGDAEIAIVGLYSQLSSLWYRDFEMMSTHGDPAISPNRVITLAQARYDYTSGFGDLANIWRILYGLIGDANKAIGRLRESDFEGRDQFLGEALFLRAYSYYILQQNWGDAPLWVDELTDNAEEIASLGRAPVEDVRNQVIADLIEASDILPTSYTGDFVKQRATRWAAQALLAKTYLYTEQWDLAEAAADDVIENGGYSLVPDYADIFTADNELNQEIILTLNYDQDLQPSNKCFRYAIHQPTIPAPLREPWMQGAGYGHYVLRNSFLDTYEPNDERLKGIVFDKNLAGDQLPFIYIAKCIRTSSPEARQGLDQILFRLADVLLVHAEAAVENNDLTAAAASLNMVRNRAGLMPTTAGSKDDLRQAVRQERLWELVAEGQGKFDRIRWGTLVDDVKALPALSKAAGEPAGLQAMAKIQADNISDKNLLFPVPDQEISKNPNLLPNNPGW